MNISEIIGCHRHSHQGRSHFTCIFSVLGPSGFWSLDLISNEAEVTGLHLTRTMQMKNSALLDIPSGDPEALIRSGRKNM